MDREMFDEIMAVNFPKLMESMIYKALYIPQAGVCE